MVKRSMPGVPFLVVRGELNFRVVSVLEDRTRD